MEPKARFSKKVNESDYLNVTVFNGKKHPEDEVIRVGVSKKVDAGQWKTEYEMTLYRTKDGKYMEMKPKPQANK